MKNKDAFLRSVLGTSPLKKNNRIIKTDVKTIVLKKIVKKPSPIKIKDEEHYNDNKKAIYKLEKSSINKKLKRGKVPINKKIDFHGLGVLDAEILFKETILNCYDNGNRSLLFVTGKGILKKNYQKNEGVKLYYGKIRSEFMDWVEKSEMQKYILSVERANIEHGADGAFYVYLRKKKLNLR